MSSCNVTDCTSSYLKRPFPSAKGKYVQKQHGNIHFPRNNLSILVY